jgi:clusterin-associated protein 1
LKLNTKKLYQADGFAVKELLKVITPLYKALRESENNELDDEDDVDHQYRYAMNDDVNIYLIFVIYFSLIQMSTLKNARLLCSTITQKGANLHELLGKEVDARVCDCVCLIDYHDFS